MNQVLDRMCILPECEEGVGSVLVTLLVFKTKGAGYNLSGGFDSHALPPVLHRVDT